jgi:hypothetical protein
MMMKRLLQAVRSLFAPQRQQPLGPPLVYLPQPVADATARLLASYGAGLERHEGVAYWAGVPAEGAWLITTVLAPEAMTTAGSYRTSAVANARVITAVNRHYLD